MLHDGVLICEAVVYAAGETMMQNFQSRGEAPWGEVKGRKRGKGKRTRRQLVDGYVQVVEDEEEEELNRQQELGFALGRVELVRLGVREGGVT